MSSRNRRTYKLVDMTVDNYVMRGVQSTPHSVKMLQYLRTMSDETGPRHKDKPCTSTTELYEYYGRSESTTNGPYGSFSSSSYMSSYYDMYLTYHLEGTEYVRYYVPYIDEVQSYSDPFSSDQKTRCLLDALPTYTHDDESILYFIRDILELRKLVAGVKEGLAGLVPRIFSKTKVKSKRAQFLAECTKRGLQGGKGFLRRFSKDYLAYSFGVVPLISDINETANLIGNIGFWSSLPKMKVRLNSRNRISTTQYDEIPNAFYSVRRSYSTATVHYGVNIVYEYDNSSPKSLSRRLAATANLLGLHRVFTQVWDALPFSFTVDWLLPVSDVLGRAEHYLSYFPQYTVISATTYTKRVTQSMRRFRHYYAYDGRPATTAPYDVGKLTVHYSRSPLSDWNVYNASYKKTSGINTRRASYILAILLGKGK